MKICRQNAAPISGYCSKARCIRHRSRHARCRPRAGGGRAAHASASRQLLRVATDAEVLRAGERNPTRPRSQRVAPPPRGSSSRRMVVDHLDLHALRAQVLRQHALPASSAGSSRSCRSGSSPTRAAAARRPARRDRRRRGREPFTEHDVRRSLGQFIGWLPVRAWAARAGPARRRQAPSAANGMRASTARS